MTAGIPACASGVGVGIAYDGTNLILSCYQSNVLQRVNATTHLSGGPVSITGLPGGNSLGALAWDATRGRLWACNDQSQVVLINVGAGTVDNSVPAFPVSGCFDGLAYDGSDDTLWTSADVSSTTCHYQTNGTLIGCFSNSGLIGSCGNSGIAVGGASLYLANNGCSQIYEVSKTFGSSSLFAGFPARLEDLECDGRTFAPNGAIWSIDAYDRTVNAWEIAPGQCAFGGLGACGDGNLDPGEQCDDGNLLNGDGCDANCQTESATSCGNAFLDPGEACDPPGSLTCPGSPAGSFLPCNADCTCPAPQSGGNGIVEGVEACDPPGSNTCPGGLTCNADCSCPAPCVPVAEICNNMMDDDCDGLVDCDDTADCPAPCPQILRDPSTITFGPPGAKLDVFKSHGRVVPNAPVDIDLGEHVTGWVLTNNNGVIYRGVLYPEDWVANRDASTFRYSDPGARKGQGKRSGIAKAKIRISRGGTSYGYRVEAYGDLSAATDPNMSIQFYLGDPSKTFTHSEPWKRTARGWRATGFSLE